MSPGGSIPDQASSVSWWVSVGTVISLMLGMFAGMIGLGRKIEAIESKGVSNEKAIKEILKLFTDSDGEPRFVTVLICDKKSSQCGVHLGDRFSHVGERITALVVEVSALRAAQDETLRAILEELRRGK